MVFSSNAHSASLSLMFHIFLRNSADTLSSLPAFRVKISPKVGSSSLFKKNSLSSANTFLQMLEATDLSSKSCTYKGSLSKVRSGSVLQFLSIAASTVETSILGIHSSFSYGIRTSFLFFQTCKSLFSSSIDASAICYVSRYGSHKSWSGVSHMRSSSSASWISQAVGARVLK